MGYYVTIYESTWRVKSDKLYDAYLAMCELNKQDKLKRGGQYDPGQGKVKSWFSWMTEDYPSECKDAAEIFDMLGFSWTFDDVTGDLLITGYDSKTGQEDLFLEAVAPFSEGYIEWNGEDGARFRYEVRNGKWVGYSPLEQARDFYQRWG